MSIVFTFANKEADNCDDWDDRDEDDRNNQPESGDDDAWEKLVKERFVNRIKKFRDEVKEIIKSHVHIPSEIVDKMHFIPAGNYKKSRKVRTPLVLPDRQDWLYDLLKMSCTDTERLIRLTPLMMKDSKHIVKHSYYYVTMLHFRYSFGNHS